MADTDPLPPFAHEMQVGDRYAPLEFVVTPEMNEQLLFAIADYHPRYRETTEEGPPIVHPVLLMQMTPRTRSPSWRLAPGMGSVFARDHSFFYAPARVGRRLRVDWTIKEVYEKRGRPYQNVEATVRDEDGTLIVRRELHSTFFMRDGKNVKARA